MAFNKNVLLFVYCIWLFIANWTVAQNDYDLTNPSENGGSQPINQQECISPKLRANLLKNIQNNIQNLKTKKKLTAQNQPKEAVLFELPLKQNTSYDNCNFYVVSAYFDHLNGMQFGDYSCGTNSYNGHLGTDYALWPFDWLMMDQQVGQVIAAADGIIIDKVDGNFDEQCVNGISYDWNYVTLLHTDSSTTLYGHLKSGSITPKPIGSSVTVGEYLGTIGSSGNSSGPHLHFEVIDKDGTSIDPYLGSCNSTNTSTSWVNQLTYNPSGINQVSTHSAVPDFNWSSCPERPEPNYKEEFYLGEPIYFVNYLRHLNPFLPIINNIYRPDGSLYTSWIRSYTPSFSDPSHHETYYWWKTYTLPDTEVTGVWTYEVSFAGETCSHPFRITGSDLHLYQSISPNILRIDDTLTYQIKIINESKHDATNVEAKAYPNGIFYLPSSNSYVASQGTYDESNAVWNVGMIPANDSATITMLYQAYEEGVFLNKAEITNMFPNDIDSKPNNSDQSEDDMARNCVSIPVSVCTERPIEVLLTVDDSYGFYQWFKDGVSIPNATSSTYTATELGEYTLEVNGGILGLCEGELCCPVILESGPCCPEKQCIRMTVQKR